MVFLQRDGRCEAHAVDGSVVFEPGGRVVAETGRNPLARQDPAVFAPLAEEQAAPHPHRSANSYPQAYEQVEQLFRSPNAPDICVQHTAAHHWPERGGHQGEHGSLGVVQARGPLIMAGAGVRERGRVAEAARIVDLAPTLAALLGVAPLHDDRPRYLAAQDGRVLDAIIDTHPTGAASPRARPRHAVVFLLDGTNANVLYDLIDQGAAPNIARLAAMGTTFEHGALSCLPTITLANHTSAVTGAFPGTHGILHNAWWDRARQQQVVTNSMATWPTAMQWLTPGVETLYEAVSRTWTGEGGVTYAVNEPCDVGATYSSFAWLRDGEGIPFPARATDVAHGTERFVRPSKDYAWSTMVDGLAVDQAVALWRGNGYRGLTLPLPRFCFVNFALTDAAFHAGGPYSEIAAASIHDTDARIGAILEAIEHAGAFDDTAFAVVSDHGMEQSNPEVTGDWDVALRDAGVEFRDEGYGFVYLGVPETVG